MTKQKQKHTKKPRTPKPKIGDVIRPEDEIFKPIVEMTDLAARKLYLAAEKALQFPTEQPADIGKPLYAIEVFAPVLDQRDSRHDRLPDFPTAVFVPQTKTWRSLTVDNLARRGKFVPLSQLSAAAYSRLAGWPVRRCTWTQSDLMLSRALYRIEVLEQRLERYSSDLDDLDTEVRRLDNSSAGRGCGCCACGCR